MTTPRIGAGYNLLFYGVVNSSGFFIGNTASGPDAGDGNGQGMARLEGARTIPILVGDDERETVFGDNNPLVQFSWPAGELPNGIFEMAVKNQTFDALVQGTKVDEIGDMSMTPILPDDATQPDIALLILRDAKKWAAGSRGSSGWEGYFVMKNQIRPLGVNVNQRQFDAYQYAFAVSKSDRKTFGATFTEVADGTTQAAMIDYTGDYPCHIHSFLGNNSQQALTLAYTPVSDAKTHVYLDGVKTAAWTRAGKVVTMDSAPGTNVVVNILYEFAASEL